MALFTVSIQGGSVPSVIVNANNPDQALQIAAALVPSGRAVSAQQATQADVNTVPLASSVARGDARPALQADPGFAQAMGFTVGGLGRADDQTGPSQAAPSSAPPSFPTEARTAPPLVPAIGSEAERVNTPILGGFNEDATIPGGGVPIITNPPIPKPPLGPSSGATDRAGDAASGGRPPLVGSGGTGLPPGGGTPSLGILNPGGGLDTGNGRSAAAMTAGGGPLGPLSPNLTGRDRLNAVFDRTLRDFLGGTAPDASIIGRNLARFQPTFENVFGFQSALSGSNAQRTASDTEQDFVNFIRNTNIMQLRDEAARAFETLTGARSGGSPTSVGDLRGRFAQPDESQASDLANLALTALSSRAHPLALSILRPPSADDIRRQFIANTGGEGDFIQFVRGMPAFAAFGF